MIVSRRLLFGLLFGAGLWPAPAAARQTLGQALTPPASAGTRGVEDDIEYVVGGRVRDLILESQGRVLYCTEEGEIGRIDPGRSVDILAPPGSFSQPLRAVAETPTGDVAAIDAVGDIFVLPGGLLPAVRVYDDAFMVLDPTDLICDQRGSFLVASSTPSNGQRGINWISDDGFRWGYYLVGYGPVALAPDPATGALLFSDETGGGVLRCVAPSDPTRPVSLFEGDTPTGFQAALDDGDIAFQNNGDLFWSAGNRIWFHDRASGSTSLFATLPGTVRGLTGACASGRLPGSTPFSLYVAEGDGPTRIRELPNIRIPADPIAIDQGWRPGRGLQTGVLPGFQIFELATEPGGNLLMGGGLYSTTFHLKRLLLPQKQLVSIADDTDGLAGIVEGIVATADGTIFTISREGVLQAITEAPFSITTLFTDPLDQIHAAKDLLLGDSGSFYVAERSGWGGGGVVRIDPAAGYTATRIASFSEARGLAPAPGGGLYASEWNGSGFEGDVGLLDLGTGTFSSLPGFTGINYTNGPVWGDGDVLVDAVGRVFTVSEDDWSLRAWTPGQTGFVFEGSGYLNRVSGLAIAPSSNGSGSTTGWSLYVSEWDFLWERPDAVGPGPSLVDDTMGRSRGRTSYR